MMQVTVLADGRETIIEANDPAVIPLDALDRATGWTLKPEGLCRGEICVPVRDRDALTGAEANSVRVAALADALHAPVVIDAEAAVVAIGEPVAFVNDALRGRTAPDFTLPALDGTPFTLSHVGRKKKVLVAWASW